MQSSVPPLLGVPVAHRAPAARRGDAPAPVEAGPPVGDPLYSLSPLRIWRYLKTQPWSFWFICIYLFFEYVRPQQIYRWLLGPPWAFMSIMLALVCFLWEGKSFRMRTSADLFLMVFSAIIVVSSFLAYYPEASFEKMGAGYFAWVLIYLLITNIIDTEKRFLVFVLSFLLYTFKMSQNATHGWALNGFAFQGHGVSGAPGWFANSGEFGIQMVVFIPLAAHFTTGLRKHLGKKTLLFFYFMMLTAVTGTIGSSSRGAMIAGAIAILFMVLRTRHKVKGLLVAGVLALFVHFLLPAESRARFEDMGDDKTSISRRHYWEFGMDVIDQHPVLGIGYSNWAPYYERFHGHTALPHNILIEVAAELGYVGLLAFLGLVVSTFVVNYKTRKLMRPLQERGAFITSMALGLDAALIGYLVAGQFVTVTYYPFFWINLAMTVALHNAARDLGQSAARPRGATGPATPRRTRPAQAPAVLAPAPPAPPA